MKGSPMKRNFGVGASPTKQISKPMGGPGDVKKDDSPLDQPWGDYYDTKNASPNKQKKDKKNKGTTVYEGRDNEKGQSQADVLDQRKKKATDYDEKVTEYAGDEGLTKEEMAAYKKRMKNLQAKYDFSADSISTVNTQINADILEHNKKVEEQNKKNKEKKKKSKESGLFDD